jgi:two-component system, NarL family, nitrate/nitrite response regulator NarL
MSISLVIADPHPMTLLGMRNTFQNNPDFEIKQMVLNGDEALEAITSCHPDVFLTELSLPKRSGLQLIEDVKNSGNGTKTVVFTSAAINEVMKAIDLGVAGLVSKDKDEQYLTSCLKQVSNGQQWLDQDLATTAVNHLVARQKQNGQLTSVLTPRELCVAKMVLEGWPNKRIASKLFLSEGTVKLHLHHIYKKLEITGRMELVLYMQKNGMA